MRGRQGRQAALRASFRRSNRHERLARPRRWRFGSNGGCGVVLDRSAGQAPNEGGRAMDAARHWLGVGAPWVSRGARSRGAELAPHGSDSQGDRAPGGGGRRHGSALSPQGRLDRPARWHRGRLLPLPGPTARSIVVRAGRPGGGAERLVGGRDRHRFHGRDRRARAWQSLPPRVAARPAGRRITSKQ